MYTEVLKNLIYSPVNMAVGRKLLLYAEQKEDKTYKCTLYDGDTGLYSMTFEYYDGEASFPDDLETVQEKFCGFVRSHELS